MIRYITFIFLSTFLLTGIYAQGPMFNLSMGQIGTFYNKDLTDVTTGKSKRMPSPMLNAVKGEVILIPNVETEDALPSVGIGVLYTLPNTDSLSFAYEDPNIYGHQLRRLSVKTFATEVTFRFAMYTAQTEQITTSFGFELGGILYKNTFDVNELPDQSTGGTLSYAAEYDDTYEYKPVKVNGKGVSYSGSGVATIFGGINYKLKDIHLLGQGGFKINLRHFDTAVVSTGFQHVAFYLLLGVGIPLQKKSN